MNIRNPSTLYFQGTHYTNEKIFEQLRKFARKLLTQLGMLFEEKEKDLFEATFYTMIRELMVALRNYLIFVQDAIKSRQSVFVFFHQLFRALYPNSSAPNYLLGVQTNNTNLIVSSPRFMLKLVATLLGRATDDDINRQGEPNKKSRFAVEFENVLGVKNINFLDTALKEQFGKGKIDIDYGLS